MSALYTAFEWEKSEHRAWARLTAMHGVQAPGNSRSPQSGRCRHITLRRDINADGGISFHPDYPRQCAVFSRDGTVNLLQLPNILPNLRRRSRKDQEAAVPMIRRRKRRDDEGSFKKLFSIPSAVRSIDCWDRSFVSPFSLFVSGERS